MNPTRSEWFDTVLAKNAPGMYASQMVRGQKSGFPPQSSPTEGGCQFRQTFETVRNRAVAIKAVEEDADSFGFRGAVHSPVQVKIGSTICVVQMEVHALHIAHRTEEVGANKVRIETAGLQHSIHLGTFIDLRAIFLGKIRKNE